jgi:hypothetical protein
VSTTAPRALGPTPRDRVDVQVASLFAQAADRVGCVERRYAIAGEEITMRFAGEEMLARLSASFSHLESGASGTPSLTVHVWESASSGVEAPPMPGERIEADEDGPFYYYERDGVQAMSRWGTLSVLNADSAEAWFWAPAAAEIVSWDWAVPFRAILHWWLGRRGVLQVHGGAVGIPDGGALLVGRGGSGKSTAALACLTAGLRYAGDDFVAISTRPDPQVHSLYGSGKVEPGHLMRFRDLVKAVSNPDPGPREKSIVFVEHAHPGAAIHGFPLRAVVVPRVVARSPETRLLPTPAPAALAALAPSTLFLLHPSTPEVLAEMAALVRSVPCFSLELGSDIDRIPDAIVELLQAAP